LSSFWLILKQQWAIEDISIFSNSSHLEWRAELSDTILKGTHPGTIPARLGLIWLTVSEEKIGWTDGRRMPNDDKSSHRLWPGELKNWIIMNSQWIKSCLLSVESREVTIIGNMWGSRGNFLGISSWAVDLTIRPYD
jgi:hypothetical protein